MPSLQKATLSLSSVQILALQESPVVIIPAPPSGSYVNVMYLTMEYVFVSTPYSVQPGDFITVAPQSHPDEGTIAFLQQGLLDQTNSVLGGLAFLITSVDSNVGPVPIVNMDGEAVVVTANADPTDGDGLLNITAFYTVEPIL